MCKARLNTALFEFFSEVICFLTVLPQFEVNPISAFHMVEHFTLTELPNDLPSFIYKFQKKTIGADCPVFLWYLSTKTPLSSYLVFGAVAASKKGHPKVLPIKTKRITTTAAMGSRDGSISLHFRKNNCWQSFILNNVQLWINRSMLGFMDYFVDNGRLLSFHLELVALPYVCLITAAVGIVNKGLYPLFTKQL